MNPDGQWIVVNNWDKFQHYSDRDPVWIKLYTELEQRDDWLHLTLAERGLLVCIWIEYGLRRGQLRTVDLPSFVLQKVPRRSLESLREAGFIHFVASQPLALARARARAKKKIEEEEKDSPKSPHRPKPGDGPVYARPDKVCPDCGETLGQGHLETCPRMPQLAAELLEEARTA